MEKQNNMNIKEFIINMFKGISVGVANVIPGVSGGTLLVITGIFERTINAIKSFDVNAIKLFLKFKIKDLIEYIDFYFLLALGTGMVIAILSIARLFDYLFNNYPVYIWSFFFGLIAPSVYFVGKTIKKWSISVIVLFILGIVFAIWLAFVNPASQNSNLFYIFICGMISITAMILPGISGSFVLLLMGNYELIVIKSIKDLNFTILLPFTAGCITGIIAFSHILSFILKKFRDETIGILTGFIAGSLIFIWPWKKPVFALDSFGNILKKGSEAVILKYERFFPNEFNKEVIIAIICMIFGVLIIAITEKIAEK
jgi:putative membrane protein